MTPKRNTLRKHLLALARKWSKPTVTSGKQCGGYVPYEKCADELRAVLRGKK